MHNTYTYKHEHNINTHVQCRILITQLQPTTRPNIMSLQHISRYIIDNHEKYYSIR